MFLAQNTKSAEQRLGYKGFYRMVKKLEAIAGVEDLKPHRFRHTLGVFKQAAAEAYLRAIGEDENM